MKNGSFRAIMSCFLFGACQFCFAGGDTNVIVVSDWSDPISLRNENLHDQTIRGRLLIVEGMDPAYGGSPTTNSAMTFVELQNVTPVGYDGIDICFDVMKLNCKLTDATGSVFIEPVRGPWGGRGPFAPSWVRLPYNSTIRLFVNGGTREPLAVYPNGEPWCHWSIAASDTNTYFLSGTLSLSTHTNQFFGECLEKEELTVQNQVRENLLYDLGYGNTTITLFDIKREYPKTFPKEWTDNNG